MAFSEMGGGDFGLPDLDAVTVNMPRRAFATAGGTVHCDWAQDSDTVTIYLAVGGARGRQLDVKIKLQRLVVARNDGGVLLMGDLDASCVPAESEWEIEDGEMKITLRKKLQREWQVPLHPEAASAAAPQATLPPAPDAMPRRSEPAVVVDDDDDEPRIVDVSEPSSSAPPDSKVAPSFTSAVKHSTLQQPPKPPGATNGLGASYRDWDKFDDIGALAGLENEGKSADGNGFTLRSGKGAVGMQCTDYVKDREEVSLDEELAAKREQLQNTINTRMVNAGRLKGKGNEKLGRGDDEGALRCYLEGVQELKLGESAKMLLSKRLCAAMESLLVDLRSNAAAACLKIEDWEGAVECADEVLASQPEHGKALYRRAKAYAAQDMHSKARLDLKTLLEHQPSNAAAKKMLSELPEKEVVV